MLSMLPHATLTRTACVSLVNDFTGRPFSQQFNSVVACAQTSQHVDVVNDWREMMAANNINLMVYFTFDVCSSNHSQTVYDYQTQIDIPNPGPSVHIWSR